jgi:putative DNA primase/helicase
MTARALEQLGIRLKQHQPGEQRAPCPECDRRPRDDALAVRLEIDGSATWLCHRCGWKGGVAGERDFSRRRENVAAPGQTDRRRSSCNVKNPAQSVEPGKHETLTSWGHRLWQECETICRGSTAATYLETRGCAIPNPFGDLRWHRDLDDKVSGYRRPALVGLVTDVETGEPINLHRTWLARDGSGKAPIPTPRRVMPGRLRGGCIRLWPDEDVTIGLAIGEGIETCLAAARSGLVPVWATMNAKNLGEFPVLPGVEGLTVLVDHDRPTPKTGRRAGIDAGLAVVQRYIAGGFDPERDIRVICSPVEGEDAADLEAVA